MSEPKTTLQTVQGQLCVALYEQLGEAVLPVIEQIYGAYGLQVGQGLQQKWQPATLQQAMESFIQMTNAGGYPSEVHMEGEVAHWTGHRCPFGLENTHRAVCEAMMAMDRALLRTLLGLDAVQFELRIDKSLAAGDGCCQGIVRLR
jgi:hypothetical protein